MSQQLLRRRSALLIVSGGLLSFLVALTHHTRELFVLGDPVGPTVALLVDGLPALALAYAGYWLSQSDLSPEQQHLTSRWCVAGVVLFGGIMGFTLLIRSFEGRIITEPLFPLLVAINTGGLAGFLAGYFQSRAQARAREAQTVSEAFEFTNSLIRHDLRNDLVVIRGHAGLLEEKLTSLDIDDPPEAPALIVDQVDDGLTRIETSHAIGETLMDEADFEPVDVAEVAAELAAQLEPTHGLTVTTDLPEQAHVRANAGLRSVIDNLLENAAEHNDADDPQVHVACEVGAETVQLSVADNGPGIPEAEREHLFEAQESASQGGLYLAGRLVDAYDGTIRVDDNEPRGTLIELELPRANSVR